VYHALWQTILLRGTVLYAVRLQTFWFARLQPTWMHYAACCVLRGVTHPLMPALLDISSRYHVPSFYHTRTDYGLLADRTGS